MYVTNDRPRPTVVSVFFFFVVFLLMVSSISCVRPPPVFCACNFTSFKNNSDYQFNLEKLSKSLVRYSMVNSIYAYRNATVGQNPNSVYGQYYCRGDATRDVCLNCVTAAYLDLSRLCSDSKSGVIGYENCTFQYSNEYFFYSRYKYHYRVWLSPRIISGIAQFDRVLSDTIHKVVSEAASDHQRFATREANFVQYKKTLFSMAQCSPFLSRNECKACLVDSMVLLSFRGGSGSDGGRVIHPSCGLRFEMYPFYGPRASPSSPLRKSNTTDIHGMSSKGILAIEMVVVGGLILLCIILYVILMRQKRKHLSKEYGGGIRIAGESLKFDFSTVLEATDSFANSNKIGQGVFGSVYKGILHNGQEVAVKRLLTSSGQGEVRFLNEAKLLAKLQHRNLVKLLGFCLEGEEKFLIFEFIHNKSLEHFLFDSEKSMHLNWETRHKIIKGIARGLLYLHEDSRLRIIHRDLKASNILLNEDMNPKIANFGLARIFGDDQTQASTTRIFGTYGYMSPEYAMHGHFSMKSDVFSFGVLVLEIIFGKKNSSFYEADGAEDLLSYVWKNWRAGIALELIDPFLRGNCSGSEVMRCIRIGLLCVQEALRRPTMTDIVLMLNSYSVCLPLPSHPALCLRSSMDSGKPVPRGWPAEADRMLSSINELEPR